MKTKTPSNVLPRIEDVTGWILVCKDEDYEGDGWHIAWLDVFGSRNAAREFAITNKWPGSWRAVRGQLSVGHQ